ncbi:MULTISPECIES: pentapeptide repeat-containing protein [unclassified Moorena]|uniref:pentapeptide repeat-containing protein n=1 Tax=unclassified Moorena TaxID=2683338 RepID=UPI0013FFDB12|nr:MULTISPECIES: pentapeptide repeat-containing protein [unclassified Moorena]NEO12935.1 pentapeptide repeat-containing protein [Moorena sp. SIO3E8]NEO42760.1 pentapeptide repeat-containing protein [Moorena sp. SIO4A3]NEP99895.1 pentapeptide repeat-containing protein [Moorena sp. SIO3F7]
MPFFSSADLSDANLKSADLTNAQLSRAIVDNTQFGDNSGIDESMKGDLIKRGAMFEDVAGDSSESLTPSQIPQTNAIKGKNAIGRRPRYANAYKYSIRPTISSGVYTSYIRLLTPNSPQS